MSKTVTDSDMTSEIEIHTTQVLETNKSMLRGRIACTMMVAIATDIVCCISRYHAFRSILNGIGPMESTKQQQIAMWVKWNSIQTSYQCGVTSGYSNTKYQKYIAYRLHTSRIPNTSSWTLCFHENHLFVHIGNGNADTTNEWMISVRGGHERPRNASPTKRLFRGTPYAYIAVVRTLFQLNFVCFWLFAFFRLHSVLWRVEHVKTTNSRTKIAVELFTRRNAFPPEQWSTLQSATTSHVPQQFPRSNHQSYCVWFCAAIMWPKNCFPCLFVAARFFVLFFLRRKIIRTAIGSSTANRLLNIF